MQRFSLPASAAFAFIFWGAAILFNQHRLSSLIPVLGAYLLAYGIGLMAVTLLCDRRTDTRPTCRACGRRKG